MRFKNNIGFDTEESFKFYMNRLLSSISLKEQAKGVQMKNLYEHSIFFNPVDIKYTEEELDEKLTELLQLQKQIIILKMKGGK